MSSLSLNESIALAGNEVHVWSVRLRAGTEDALALRGLLDDEERGRAERYLHQPTRQQFIAARAALRTLLGRYLRIPPRCVRFETTGLGKPILAGRELHFNVSHSHEVAVIALTRMGEVGVDVERVRPQPSHLDMAERFFTPGETRALRRLPPGASEEAFFHVWTRKEAFLKALGLGLSHGLERFEVSVPPDNPARVLHVDGDRRIGAIWQLRSMHPARGYVGAMAIAGPEARLRTGTIGLGQEVPV